MNMFETMFSRRSIRHFLNETLEWSVIADILQFADQLPMLYEGIAVEFKLVSNIEKKQGFFGPLPVKAPYYLCISSEEKDNYLINAGYLMEQMNLYIQSKGLGACFVGANPGKGLKDTMKYRYVVGLAFGKTASTLYRDSSKAIRLPEEEIVVYKEEVSPNIKKMLTAARLAPSAYNSQPWRFVVYKNRIHIFAKKSTIMIKMLDFNKMIDIGIMLANLLLAAEELWIDVKLAKSDAILSKQFQNNEYITTLLIG